MHGDVDGDTGDEDDGDGDDGDENGRWLHRMMMNFLSGAKGAKEPHRHCLGDRAPSCDDDDCTQCH